MNMEKWLVVLGLTGVLFVSGIFALTNQESGKIAFTSDRDGNWEIYLMEADGTNQINLTRHRRNDSDPTWSPDGTQIAFVSERERESGIWVMDADGSNAINLTGGTYYDWKPAWSPDGKKIAFVSDRTPPSMLLNFDVFVMDTHGKHVVNLTNDPAWDTNPSWSPDGKQIAFNSNRGGRWELYVMNADGSDVKKLIDSPAYDSEPEWAPDGKKIVFYSRRDNTPDIYVINADGTGLQRLTNDAAWDSDPSWSPDGKQIIFYSDRNGAPDIYVMDTGGSNMQRLTNDPDDNWSPQWCCPSHGSQTVSAIGFTQFILVLVFSYVIFLQFKGMSPASGLNVFLFLFLFLVTYTLSVPQANVHPHEQYICPLCQYTVETTEELQVTVLDLMEDARDYGVSTPEIEVTVSEARDLLERARTFCFRSQNCIAGNTLAHESQALLKEAHASLSSILESIPEDRVEEYAVYSALIRAKYTYGRGFSKGEYLNRSVQVYVIEESTSTDGMRGEGFEGTLQYVCREMSEPVDQTILNEFRMKNARSHPLDDLF
ncbi:MAG: PD40 domain-containing protein, partial [Theionarchaea archaeon]|nr:PD40 domain-containing protein [Theionarchaea archaeon]